MAKKRAASRPRVPVLLGPTASGKTALAVALARAIGGEIISADSRQVFRGLDVGSGKDLAEYVRGGRPIRHHLIDVADVREGFNLASYQQLAQAALADVLARGRRPIVVGGSGLYLQALVDGYQLPEAGFSPARRQEYELLGAPELYSRLQKRRPDFAARLNASDRNNPRRLGRYLEIIEGGGEIGAADRRPPLYDYCLFGLAWPDEKLRLRAAWRLLQRLENEGLVDEVWRLHRAGVSWERLHSLGLEYRYIGQHLRGELSYNEMVRRLEIATWRFIRRQKTWFRRWERSPGRKITWLDGEAGVETNIEKIRKSCS